MLLLNESQSDEEYADASTESEPVRSTQYLQIRKLHHMLLLMSGVIWTEYWSLLQGNTVESDGCWNEEVVNLSNFSCSNWLTKRALAF
jgi:hypothetical protein